MIYVTGCICGGQAVLYKSNKTYNDISVVVGASHCGNFSRREYIQQIRPTKSVNDELHSIMATSFYDMQ